jgi:hypothetical protein
LLISDGQQQAGDNLWLCLLQCSQSWLQLGCDEIWYCSCCTDKNINIKATKKKVSAPWPDGLGQKRMAVVSQDFIFFLGVREERERWE